MDYSTKTKFSNAHTCSLEQPISPFQPQSVVTTPSRIFTTEDMAHAFDVEPNSIRSALCRHGQYMGIIPIKLPNRRLAWNADAVERLLSTGEAK